MRLSGLIVALLLNSALAARSAKRFYDTHDYYVLEHDPSAAASLAECAEALGVEIVEQAGELLNHWLVRTSKPPLSARDSEDRVLRAFDIIRSLANSPLNTRTDHIYRSKRVASSVRYLSRQTLRQRIKRAPPPIRPEDSDAPSAEDFARQQSIVDPEFTKQWHLINNDFPQHMMNVTSLWEKGITGKGVITTLIDDGLDYNSDDLAPNFVSP
jgi:kexin